MKKVQPNGYYYKRDKFYDVPYFCIVKKEFYDKYKAFDETLKIEMPPNFNVSKESPAGFVYVGLDGDKGGAAALRAAGFKHLPARIKGCDICGHKKVVHQIITPEFNPNGAYINCMVTFLCEKHSEEYMSGTPLIVNNIRLI